MSIQSIHLGNFDEFVHGKKTAVIGFSAAWCQPCKNLKKIFADIVDLYSGDVSFGEVDIEDHPQLADQFQIRTIPFVMIVRDAVVVYADSGLVDKQEMCRLIDETLALPADEINKLKKD